MTFTTWYLLGLCTGFVPGDDELTYRLCEAQFEAKMRHIPGNPDGFDYDEFYQEIRNVCWPKHKCRRRV